tara:strand:+ start:106 stop:315 length:210 start_codon:yes stop_codon:yes gene_type:complete
MESFSNFLEFLRIALILIIGGTVFKACISVLEGKKIEVNLLNPLNLKARWPIEKKTPQKEGSKEKEEKT